MGYGQPATYAEAKKTTYTLLANACKLFLSASQASHISSSIRLLFIRHSKRETALIIFKNKILLQHNITNKKKV